MTSTLQLGPRPAVWRHFAVCADGGAPVCLSLWRTDVGTDAQPSGAEILLSRGERGRRHPLARLQAQEPLARDFVRVLLEPDRSSYVVDSAVVALAHLLAEPEAG